MLEARERQRSHASLGLKDWIVHTDLVSELVGAPLIPGMAKRLFKLLPDERKLLPLRDLLLQLAPGFIQITASLMDEYFEKREVGRTADTPDGGREASDNKPAVAAFGGNKNSCYMWREEGPALKAWSSDAAASDAN